MSYSNMCISINISGIKDELEAERSSQNGDYLYEAQAHGTGQVFDVHLSSKSMYFDIQTSSGTIFIIISSKEL